MKVAVSATGPSLEAAVDPRFGRCACFVVVDTEDGTFQVIDNGSSSLGGGAGIQAARLVAERGATTVLTGSVGPNAHETLSAAGIAVVLDCGGTVSEAVARLRAGGLRAAAGPNVAGHAGLGRGGR
jgi:predicted Fe-Mo cluster-binding NifX family protein